MADPKVNTAVLNLQAGERVEVCSESEILSTLDALGRLDALPFMPEMLQYCGKQFTVQSRADKTCDTINNSGSRRMWNTVHLAELRCDGSGHDGCQARCLLFWKEAWLKRVGKPNKLRQAFSMILGMNGNTKVRPSIANASITRDMLVQATRVWKEGSSSGEKLYSCQATEMLKASVPLSWWRPGQYVRDVCSGNVSPWYVMRTMMFRAFAKSLTFGAANAQISIYNGVQRILGGRPYPFRTGRLNKTPSEKLNLQAGELVQVKSHEEILETLDERSRNRGLYFDVEMTTACGGQHRVIQRVERIINDRTGKLIQLPGGCIMLEGVVCRALYSDRRIACPRRIYSFWREVWLRRVD
jgi:hypothetical protein